MQIRLTSVQRKLLSRTFLIGAILTLTMIVVEMLGLLTALERFLYDNRAYYFQYFSPAPSTQIFHVSIDDASTNEMGRWPWPRSTIATLVDEINRAGAKVVTLDIIMPEPEKLRYERVGLEKQSYIEIDDDRVLADAFRRAGNVLLPAAAGQWMRPDQPRISVDMVRFLEEDLEQTTAELEARLVAAGYRRDEITSAIQDEILLATDQAIFQRMRAAMAQGHRSLDELKAIVAPKAAALGQRTDAALAAERVYRQLTAFEVLMRFSRPLPENVPLLRNNAHTTQPPVAVLLEAAAYSGYAEFLQFDDGVVRTVPLIADIGGRAIPHMALSTALAYLDVPFADLKIEPDRLIIPLKDGDAITIPVRIITSRHGEAGAFLDLVWFGPRDNWWSMYDPDRLRPVQQEALKNVWRVEQFRQSIARNEEIIFDGLKTLNDNTGVLRTSELIERWTTADSSGRVGLIELVLSDENTREYKAELAKMKPEEYREEERELLRIIEQLGQVARNNTYLAERIEAERKSMAEKFAGKIVLVGWTAAGQYDYYPTSLHAQCPGVVIQSVAINSILTRHFWRYAPDWLAPIITLLAGGAVTLMTAFLPSYRALLATVALAVAYYLFNALLLFDYMDHIVPLAGALTASGLVWGILTLYRYIFESAERTRITRRFSSYVDPAIVNYYIDDPDRVHLDGDSREMTVVFTDLAGFTTISEKLQERTVPLLNEYMARMMPVIRRNRGRWNKFLGDGIMFFYNAPDDNPNHARDAVITVLEMQKEVEEFNKYLFAQQLPKVAMRAGIVTGRMIAGDAGSIGASDPQNVASDYTVLGDNVNLSARLESANKALGSRILCAEDTIKQMGNGILHRPMARLQVVGKTLGVMTYEVLCFEQDATDDTRELIRLTRCVVEAYLEGRFADCVAAAEAMQDRFGSSKFTQLYLQSAREFSIAPPGDDFDGTIVLEAK